MRNRGKQRTSALDSPRVGEGASDTLSAFGHSFLQRSLDGPGLRRARGVTPLASPTRVPLDPVGLGLVANACLDVELTAVAAGGRAVDEVAVPEPRVAGLDVEVRVERVVPVQVERVPQRRSVPRRADRVPGHVVGPVAVRGELEEVMRDRDRRLLRRLHVDLQAIVVQVLPRKVVAQRSSRRDPAGRER